MGAAALLDPFGVTPISEEAPRHFIFTPQP